MNSTQAHQLLHQVMHIDPDYTTSESHSTFLVVEMVRQESADALQLTVIIIDPSIPNSGDAIAYLKLNPVQRLALELSQIITTTVSGISAVVQHAPLDEDLWKAVQRDKNSLVQMVRAMATKAAVVYLENDLPPDLSLPKIEHGVIQ